MGPCVVFLPLTCGWQNLLIFIQKTRFGNLWIDTLALKINIPYMYKVYSSFQLLRLSTDKVPQKESAKWTWKIIDAHCIFQNHLSGLDVSLCTKFQLDCSYSYGVFSPKVSDLFALSDSKDQGGHPNIDRHLDWPLTSGFTKFQVDSFKPFWVMLWKLNLAFVTPVTFIIKVMTPKWIGILRGL